MTDDPADLVKGIPRDNLPRCAAAPKAPRYEEPHRYYPSRDDGDTVDFMPDPEFQLNDLPKRKGLT